MTVGAGTLEVLIVCTGNVCRSPQTVALLRKHVAAAEEPLRSAVHLASAGTHALVGAPMDPKAAELAVVYGAADTEHSGRQLTSQLVKSSDLVLCMTREQRSTVVRHAPAASRRVFLLAEFVVLVEGLATVPETFSGGSGQSAQSPAGLRTSVPDRLREGIDAVAARRGLAPHPPGIPVEIIDPYRREPEIHRESVAQINQAVQRLDHAVRTIAQRTPR
ncbi:MAG: hypothetical protein ACTHWO_01485 [Nesterenkonia sp.]